MGVGPSSILHCFTAIVVLVASAAATAEAVTQQDVERIRPAATRPVAVRGGVMVIDLDAARHGSGWPHAVRCEFASGHSVSGDVVWIYAAERHDRPHWTSPAIPLRVRRIEPPDDSSSGLGRPLLILDVPATASGELRLLGTTLSPVYASLPAEPAESDDNAAAAPAEQLERTLAADRPDLDSPLEHWRWVVLARRLGVAPPPPSGSEIEQRLARYQADLWRVALGRLASASGGVEAAVLEVLSGTCEDHDRAIAAWITEQSAIDALLDVLLDPSQSAASLARRALDWAEAQETMTFWIERAHGEQVEIAFANPRSLVHAQNAARLVQFRWVFADPALNEAEIPIMVELQPQRVTHIVIDRPALRESSAATEPPQLDVQSETFSRRFSISARRHAATPPGLRVDAFVQTLTLASARALRLERAPEPFATFAEIRRREGRWEIFFECFRPGGSPAHLSPDSTHLHQLGAVEHTAGHEAVTIFIGPQGDGAHTILTVPEIGSPRAWRGDAQGFEIARSSYHDRWWCTVVLGDGFEDALGQGMERFGFARTHRDAPHIESAPGATLPWSFDPGRIEVDFTSWLALPGQEARGSGTPQRESR